MGIGLDRDSLWRLLGRRAPTIKTCYQILRNIENPRILELGTTRSFRNGSIDTENYSPNPGDWDWGAGCFTVVMALLLPGCKLTSVDPLASAIGVSRQMTEPLGVKVDYRLADSTTFLESTHERYDLIYMDHAEAGDSDACAILHKNDAGIILSRNLLLNDGLILIDDVRERFGKGMYSIPFLKQFGFSEISNTCYQTLLRRDDFFG